MNNDNQGIGMTVLITGTARGIGRQMAQDFAAAKYRVVGVDIVADPADSFVLQARSLSPQSREYRLDVGDAEQVDHLFKIILAENPPIDVLINNAGVMRDKMFLKMDYQEWDSVMKTNLYGAFNITKQVLPGMVEKNWGRVISVSSVVGKLGNYGQTNYSASKAGLLGFTKSLAKEVAKHNITVNAICPGLVRTDMIKDVPPKYLAKMLDRIPAKRLAETKEISDLALFLASEDSAFMTGSLVDINGGWL